MTTGQILDRAFRLYRENFLRYVAIVALVQVPVGLLMVAGVGIFYSHFTSLVRAAGAPRGVQDLGPMMVGGAAMGVSALLSFVSLVLSMAAMARSMSASYLGGDLPVSQAYRALRPRIGWLMLMVALLIPTLVVLYVVLVLAILGIVMVAMAFEASHLGTAATVVAVGVATVLATAVLALAFFAAAVIFSLAIQSIMIEDQNAFMAIARSSRLILGNVRKSLTVATLALVLLMVPLSVVSGTGFAVAFLVFGPANLMAQQVVQQSLSLIMNVLILPVWGAAMLLLYYDLRIRKEGFDLEMLARTLRPMEAAPHAGAR